MFVCSAYSFIVNYEGNRVKRYPLEITGYNVTNHYPSEVIKLIPLGIGGLVIYVSGDIIDLLRV